MKNFWKKLEKPVICLAPMADVTDAAFRQMIAKYGKPDVMWTEFVSADGLCSEGREAIMPDLIYSESERPIVAQIFGSKPENIERVAALCRKLGFDGVDINMGCPDRSVEKQGAGSALIKNPTLAQEIIRAAQRGAKDIPVSVKTRIGYNTIQTKEWVSALLEAQPTVITLHLRTRKEMSKVPARWEEIEKAVALAKGTGTLIIGNGDVTSVHEAHEKCARHGCDGVMIGRGIFGNPWFFNTEQSYDTVPLHTKLKVMLEHAQRFDELLGGKKNFLHMRKTMGAYLKGYPYVKELRMTLMEAKSIEDVQAVISEYIKKGA